MKKFTVLAILLIIPISMIALPPDADAQTNRRVPDWAKKEAPIPPRATRPSGECWTVTHGPANRQGERREYDPRLSPKDQTRTAYYRRRMERVESYRPPAMDSRGSSGRLMRNGHAQSRTEPVPMPERRAAPPHAERIEVAPPNYDQGRQVRVPRTRGNNGVGNGIDPQPPGNPPVINDGAGTGPGNPGARQQRRAQRPRSNYGRRSRR